MYCHERKALRWWIKFERARLYEIRRHSVFPFLLNHMALHELRLWESKIHKPELLMRLERMKGRRHKYAAEAHEWTSVEKAFVDAVGL